MGKKSQLKQQQKTPLQTPKQPSPNILRTVVLVGLCVLLFYPPYYRAMFFAREQLPTHLFTYILFFLWTFVKYQKKDSSFLRSPLDWFTFGFALIYLLTLPVAINTRGAIQEFLKVSNYFLIYWLVSQIIDTKNEARLILNVLVLSALGVAILGLGAAAGTWQIHGGYKDGRIFSTIQYPNSLASYLTGAFLVTLGLFQNATGKFKRLYPVVAFLLLITVILTYSRGGWLIFPVFAFAYFLLIPRPKKPEAFFTLGITLVVCLALTPLLGRLFQAERGAMAWLLILAGALLVIFLQFVVFDLPKKIKPAVIITCTLICTLLLLLAVGINVSRTLARPLVLGHAGSEPASDKLFEERLTVHPNTQYNLALEINALDSANQPYSWRVILIAQHDDGSTSWLLNERGKATNAWETKDLAFSTPENVRRIIVRLVNTHPGTSFETRNVVLTSENSRNELTFNWYRALPPVLYNRLFTFKAQEKSVAERFIFFRDAWSIIKDYPLLGLGGHGWKSRYFQYQTAVYSTTEVHNHFLQVWVETGILGFLLFFGIWISFLYTSYMLFRSSPYEDKITVSALLTAVLAVVTHSIYDFNLSLGAICMFLWAMMGVTRSFIPKEKSKSSWAPYQIFIPGMVILVLLIFVTGLQVGYASYLQGSSLLRANQTSQAVATLEKAAKYDRFDPEIRVALSESYEYLGMQTQNQRFVQKAEAQLSKALSLDRWHPRYKHAMGSLLIRTGNFDSGLEFLTQTISLQPRFEKHYSIFAIACLNIAEYMLSLNDRQQAEAYLNKIFSLEESLIKYFPESKALAYSFGQAYFRLGDVEKALESLEIAYRVAEDRASAAMVISLIYEQKGDLQKAKKYYDQALQWEPASKQLYDTLKKI